MKLLLVLFALALVPPRAEAEGSLRGRRLAPTARSSPTARSLGRDKYVDAPSSRAGLDARARVAAAASRPESSAPSLAGLGARTPVAASAPPRAGECAATTTRTSACRAAVAKARRPWARAGDRNFQHLWSKTSQGGDGLAVEGRCLLYAAIFKAGNDSIRLSLKAMAKRIRAAGLPLALNRTRNKDLEAIRSGPTCARGAVTFTFVREPLGHFLSGFTEWAYRQVNLRGRVSKTIDRQVASEVLLNILGGRPPRPWEDSQHMYWRQSGIPREAF